MRGKGRGKRQVKSERRKGKEVSETGGKGEGEGGTNETGGEGEG